MAIKNLTVKGAKEHNLKNVNVEIPRDKLVVFYSIFFRSVVEMPPLLINCQKSAFSHYFSQ